MRSYNLIFKLFNIIMYHKTKRIFMLHSFRYTTFTGSTYSKLSMLICIYVCTYHFIKLKIF